MRIPIVLFLLAVTFGVTEKEKQDLVGKVKPDLDKMMESEKVFEDAMTVAFRTYDVDKDGQLNFMELFYLVKQACKAINHPFPGKRAITKIIEHIDTDKNGKVDQEELKLLATKLGAALKEAEKENNDEEEGTDGLKIVKEDL